MISGQPLTEMKSNMASNGKLPRWVWSGESEDVVYNLEAMKTALLSLDQPVYAVRQDGKTGLSNRGLLGQAGEGIPAEGYAPALLLENLGDTSFRQDYGTRCAYYTGAMAHGIASENMVIALGKAGLLGSFGAAGMVPPRLEAAIQKVQQELPRGPYAFNLIHSPSEEAMERQAVELYLRLGVRVVEASAFLDLTPSIVRYRAAGLSVDTAGNIVTANHVIAKVSRAEVARKFMQPAPASILTELVQAGWITAPQAELAQKVPMAEDVTVEADSGGHTDNRPLVCLIPGMLALRDEIQAKYQYRQPVRVGAGGGISTPGSALGAFMMGAAYIVTGSVNQACVESGASEHTKSVLAQAGMADVTMAPSADMFEMGVKVQVLRKGTLFPMRAQKLYDLYQRYSSIDEIPTEEREKVEKQIFQRSLESVWQDTEKFFTERDPEQIQRANENPKRKMALIFRWYLGLSSRWSNSGEKGREMDFQIWCGPSIGPFNDWLRGTYLEDPKNRRVVDVALHILTGAAYLYRLQSLRLQGVSLPAGLDAYKPITSLA